MRLLCGDPDRREGWPRQFHGGYRSPKLRTCSEADPG